MPRRPKRFQDFVAQQRTIKHLAKLVEGAHALGEPCPSLLLTAPSGFGKSSLAAAIAAAMGTQMTTLMAGADVTPVQLCETLQALNCADILLIDEAHALRPGLQELLYSALEDAKVPVRIESGLNRSATESIAEFTAILATNEPGRLKAGLRNRLLRVELDPYSVDDLRDIALSVAGSKGYALTSQAARRLAESAQGVPRAVANWITRLPFHYPGEHHFAQQHVETLLAAEGIDAHGLRPPQRHYLAVLAQSRKGVCPLGRLKAKLGYDVKFTCEEIEPYLIDQGLVELDGREGRKITADGRAIVAELHAAQTADRTGEVKS